MNVRRIALDNYDANTDKYDHLMSKVKYVKYLLNEKDNEHNSIVLLDKDHKVIFESRIESVGNYYCKPSVWIWGWAVPSYEKNRTIYSRKLLTYAFNLPKEDILLRSHLITSRLKVNHSCELDSHIALYSYLTKMPLIIGVAYDLSIKTPINIHDVEMEYHRMPKSDNKDVVIYYHCLLDYLKIDQGSH